MSEQKSAETILKDIFGFAGFRDQQAEIIADVAAGRNVLTVMPTGAGKSLCFQIPALMGAGLTIVVSPLISLMQNQVEALRLLGVEAATLNSNNSPEQDQAIWQKIREGALKLLYVSPEKLLTAQMMELTANIQIDLFAIDEAHCISQWGAAFRPEYEGLAELHQKFPHIPIIALTATADQATQEQICQKIFSGNVTTYLSGFDRPNISLTVEIKKGWKQQLLAFLKNRPQENGIVYCLSRKKTDEAAHLLTEAGYRALPYHAGMTGAAREGNLNRFMVEDDLIMVATIAFGMGIDKPDIRFVFHTDLPATPEAYYQEIGRAGRDGEPATAHMLYGMDDIRMRRMFIENEGGEEGHRRRSHQRLNALLAYCEAPECRRVSLLRYFGEDVGFVKCGNCDLCENPKETIEATELAQKLLSAIYRTGQNFGIGHIVDIVRGSKNARVEQLRHHLLPTYGVGADLSTHEWKSVARQLMARGFIAADMDYGSLKITEEGRRLLKGRTDFRYRPDILIRKTSTVSKKSAHHIAELSEDAETLFQALKTYRRELAAARSVPAYIIFSDKSLVDMANRRPANLDQFGEIYGVGTAKREEFGPRFIQFIQDQNASG